MLNFFFRDECFISLFKLVKPFSLGLVLLIVLLSSACSQNHGDDENGIYGTGYTIDTPIYARVSVRRLDNADENPKTLCELQDLTAKFTLPSYCFSEAGEIHLIEAELIKIDGVTDDIRKGELHSVYIPESTDSEVELTLSEQSERIYQYIIYGSEKRLLSNDELITSLNMLASDVLNEDVDKNGSIDYLDVLALNFNTEVKLSELPSSSPEVFYDNHQALLHAQLITDFVGTWAVISQDFSFYGYSIDNAFDPQGMKGLYREFCQITHVIDKQYSSSCFQVDAQNPVFHDLVWQNDSLQGENGAITLKIQDKVLVGQAQFNFEYLDDPDNKFRTETILNKLYATKIADTVLPLAEVTVKAQLQEYKILANYIIQYDVIWVIPPFTSKEDMVTTLVFNMASSEQLQANQIREVVQPDGVSTSPAPITFSTIDITLESKQTIDVDNPPLFNEFILDNNNIGLPLSFVGKDITTDVDFNGNIDWQFLSTP